MMRAGRSTVAIAGFALAVAAGCASAEDGDVTSATPRSSTSVPATTQTSPPAEAPPATAAPEPVPVAGPVVPIEPARVRVPAIGVDAPVIRLGLDDRGALEVPDTAHETGWWSGGARPGDVGPAVIVGHVNLRREAGVFARLRELVPGDRIEVEGPGGTTQTYDVTRVERHPKDSFPTDAVYGATDGPELRLITCGGDFDRGSGRYRDNVIAFAVPVDAPAGGHDS